MLANYWWHYLVPAKHLLAGGGSQEELDALQPPGEHSATAELRAASKRMAAEAHGVFFRP